MDLRLPIKNPFLFLHWGKKPKHKSYTAQDKKANVGSRLLLKMLQLGTKGIFWVKIIDHIDVFKLALIGTNAL